LAFANAYLKGNQRRMLRRGAATNTRDGCAPQSKMRGAASYELIRIEVEVFNLFFCRGSCASCDSLRLLAIRLPLQLWGAHPSRVLVVLSRQHELLTNSESAKRKSVVARRNDQHARRVCAPIQCARYGGMSRGRDHRSRHNWQFGRRHDVTV